MVTMVVTAMTFHRGALRRGVLPLDRRVLALNGCVLAWSLSLQCRRCSACRSLLRQQRIHGAGSRPNHVVAAVRGQACRAGKVRHCGRGEIEHVLAGGRAAGCGSRQAVPGRLLQRPKVVEDVRRRSGKIKHGLRSSPAPIARRPMIGPSARLSKRRAGPAAGNLLVLSIALVGCPRQHVPRLRRALGTFCRGYRSSCVVDWSRCRAVREAERRTHSPPGTRLKPRNSARSAERISTRNDAEAVPARKPTTGQSRRRFPRVPNSGTGPPA
jgi:hypothetical protein